MAKQLGIDMAQGYLISQEVNNINEIKISYDHINKILKIDRREQIIDEDLIRKELRMITPIEIDAPMEQYLNNLKLSR